MATLSNVNIGTSPNDGTGDDLRTAFTTVNTNFQALDGIFPDIDVADLEANITSTGVSTFNILNGATIGNTGAEIIGSTVSAATIGNASASLLGTISTSAQTNITSLGTLTELTVSGTLSHTGKTINAITTVISDPYVVVDTDSVIVGNLEASGNVTVTIPNASVSTGRSLYFTVYDPSGALDLRMVIATNSGSGNIFLLPNLNFETTSIGVNVGVNNVQLISNGQYWIAY